MFINRFQSEKGICTSIALNDHANFLVIQTVLSQWLSGTPIESARRTNYDWVLLHDMPMNFIDYRFRSAGD